MRPTTLTLAVLALSAPAMAQKVGDKVTDVTFPTFFNGDGRQNLADFFGQPIVIDQWGTH